jgi:hypothetical protein
MRPSSLISRAKQTLDKIDLLTALLKNIYWNGFDHRGTSYRIARSKLRDLAGVQRLTAAPIIRDCEMISDSASAQAARLMAEFAMRTGLRPPARDHERYLWTDAFAVCNFLELFRRTHDEEYLRYATVLIDEVHQVLGRYRDDDMRSGWISGRDEETARLHPTTGGLRIGKPLKEREAGEPIDERLEWDRDGQYFHYLTKWMHALCQAAFVAGETTYARWAVELGEAAFEGFARRSHSGEIVGIYWKMSTDLSRPLVAATGLHDALDGFITFREARHAGKTLANVEATGLGAAIKALSLLCQHGNWTTDDPLELGGLLFDACRLCQLPGEEGSNDVRLLEELIEACRNGLMAFLAGRQLSRPAWHRLAFRELGLAIGLRALPRIADVISRDRTRFGNSPALRRTVELIVPYQSLSERIVSFWMSHAQHSDANWAAHQNINDVMLATALVPDTFLSVGQV